MSIGVSTDGDLIVAELQEATKELQAIRELLEKLVKLAEMQGTVVG